jgi:zinc/manganese transport system ATP-binding protein
VSPTVELVDAELTFPGRTLWSGLDLAVAPGQFLAVLGPNGSGKSSLIKVILGLLPLTRGQARVGGQPVRQGNRSIGYVPQSRGFGVDVPMRGGDFVQLGIDGNRWGLPAPRRHRRVVADLLAQVEAEHLADRPIGELSGGEQQRLRIAQALATDPQVLLCDEALLSLDLRHQQRVVDIIDKRRRDHGTSVVFVTHEINPVLPVTDSVLYMMDGRFRLGAPDEVMRTEVLSALYGSPIEVIRRGEQLVVLGGDGGSHVHEHGAHDTRAAAR